MARAERWEEEGQLLRAEMVRCLVFLDYKAARWRYRANRCGDVSDDIKAGLIAYAEKQAYICEQQAQKFASNWVGLFKEYAEELPATWPPHYTHIPYVVRNIKERRHRTKAYRRLQEQNAMDVDT